MLQANGEEMVVPDTRDGDVLDDLKDKADKAGRAAVAAVLAGSIAAGAGALTPDQVQLPEPVPIVQVLDMGGDQAPDTVVEDQQDEKQSPWRKILKYLLLALAALALAVGVVLGALQGCTSCSGPLAAPVSSEQQDQTSSQG